MSGIRVGDLLQTLLAHKSQHPHPEENLELAAIGKLDEIFSYINAVIAAKSCI
jgi:cob(I)alamin adenosyltransferase